jgi:hypothetical protein
MLIYCRQIGRQVGDQRFYEGKKKTFWIKEYLFFVFGFLKDVSPIWNVDTRWAKCTFCDEHQLKNKMSAILRPWQMVALSLVTASPPIENTFVCCYFFIRRRSNGCTLKQKNFYFLLFIVQTIWEHSVRDP